MIAFSKYEGAGNDFILFDDREQAFPCHASDLINQLCNRNKGIGADGLILLQTSKNADHRMRIFNSDGNETEMCGNGLRCLVRFLEKLGIEKTQFTIETQAGVLEAHNESGAIKVCLGIPKKVKWNLDLGLEEKVHLIDTGVPHAVIFVPNIKEIDINSLGPALRHHPHFGSEGANVNFVTKVSDKVLAIRTYERGVEAETLACGTGVSAAAVAARKLYNLEGPISAHVKSGDKLEVNFDNDLIYLSGPANHIFTGTIKI